MPRSGSPSGSSASPGTRSWPTAGSCSRAGEMGSTASRSVWPTGRSPSSTFRSRSSAISPWRAMTRSSSLPARATEEASVTRVSLGPAGSVDRVETLRPARDLRELGVDPGYVSVPEPISFPSAGGRTAHGLLYRPANPEYRGSDDELPPLLVAVHGGPTAAHGRSSTSSLQYLTSRGFAVIDVNYGGSSGYGRAYRDLLEGSWGIVDVEDTIAAARWLVEQGRVDRPAPVRRGRLGRRLHDARGAGTGRDAVRRRGRLLRGSGPGDVRDRYAQVRESLPGQARRAVSRRRASYTASDLQSTTSTSSHARCWCSRGSRTRSCHPTRRR